MRIRVIITFMVFIFLLSYNVRSENGLHPKPYLLVISFDGFRWDYLDRGLTPNVNKIAEQGVRALTFQPSFPSKTFPNHYSIVTGLYPQNHGIINNKFINPANNKMYQLSDRTAVRDSYWYSGESIWETAEKQGIKTASFFWPGSEVRTEYKHPHYYKLYDGTVTHEERIDGVIDWLILPEKDRPHLLFLYFSDTDTEGHHHGPESDKVNEAIRLLDQKTGLLLNKLQGIGMAEKMNIIIVSDHGMTTTQKEGFLFLDEILQGLEYHYTGYSPVVQFFAHKNQNLDSIYQRFKQDERGYKVYLKKDIPDAYHYAQHPYIADLLLVAEPGFTIFENREQALNHTTKGDHGYDNRSLDMHGIFVAKGPAFKVNYRTGTILNIDLYSLMAKILKIYPSQKIDGKLERIEHVLK